MMSNGRETLENLEKWGNYFSDDWNALNVGILSIYPGIQGIIVWSRVLDPVHVVL